MQEPIWLWAGFTAFVLLLLGIDLGLFNRKAHAISYRQALGWSAIWITLALLFAGVIYWRRFDELGTSGAQDSVLKYLTGYIIELSLSVDNLFVFLLIFSYFKVPAKYQHRVLYWGVLGALVMRALMIIIGATLITKFHWIIYLFGAFLVYTGVKMFLQKESDDVNPENNLAVRAVTRVLPVTRGYDGEQFFTRKNGKLYGTLMLLVLVTVEVTDLVFAVDSIPAIFAITTDAFIVYTSNVFAILGLRTFYFLLAGVVEKFHYLKLGLSVVLTFVGLKMLVEGFVLPYVDERHIILFSLAFVVVVLLGSVAASLIFPKRAETNIEVQLPEDFNSPHDDDHGHLGAEEPPA
ncbi:MAG: tellurite resistance protein TerC [Acidobacteriota bacterium]|nr:tellurite resistance protein TerC [Acidobacteriota bacterium]